MYILLHARKMSSTTLINNDMVSQVCQHFILVASSSLFGCIGCQFVIMNRYNKMIDNKALTLVKTLTLAHNNSRPLLIFYRDNKRTQYLFIFCEHAIGLLKF